MKRTDLITAMKSLNFHPSRHLGQNFLVDENLLAYIARLGNVTPGERILEVGPGFGSLTEQLLAVGARVLAVEFDYRLAGYLRERFGSEPNFQLIEADACKVDFETLFRGTAFRVIANLPYCISTPLVMKLLELPEPPKSMTVMLQKEVGERICALPRTKDYGSISVCIQNAYETALDRLVPPQVFCPEPDVDSALITLQARDPFPSKSERMQFARIVRAAFAQRRKKMSGVLGKTYGREKVEAALSAVGVRPDARPEMLSPLEWKGFIAQIIVES